MDTQRRLDRGRNRRAKDAARDMDRDRHGDPDHPAVNASGTLTGKPYKRDGNMADKALLILYSYHHGNTEKIAQCFSRVLDAAIKEPAQIDPEELTAYALIGFGSGIYGAAHHASLLELAGRLPQANGNRTFLFSTHGTPRNLVADRQSLHEKMRKDHAALREKLTEKGYVIAGEFNCGGYNTNSFLRLFGGINRGRPGAEDLIDAAVFAEGLRNSMYRYEDRFIAAEKG